MHYTDRELIQKGWSADRKYCARGDDGQRYLLRISDIGTYETKKAEFHMMQKVAALGIPMCLPLEFGICEDVVYSRQSWIDGVDAEDVIKAASPARQYAYGLEAGRILRKIHSLSAPSSREDWETFYQRKLDSKIRSYAECPLKYENGQLFLDYISENRHLVKGRPQVYQHGDYHRGNMMIGKDGKLYIIDFNRNDYGDPWEEIKAITWDVAVSPAFASGRIDGYFERDIPDAFWPTLALYISCGVLSSLPWAIPFGEAEIETMRRQAEDVLRWYDSMRDPVPAWYRPSGFWVE